MSAIEGATGTERSPEPVSLTYRRLLRAGFGPAEAGNLVALKSGLPIRSQPWTVRQLGHLLFLRDLRRTGRSWSGRDDDDSATERIVLASMPDLPKAPAAPSMPSPSNVGGSPAAATTWWHRDDADPADGRVTLLTLFRAVAGPNATLDALRPSGRSPFETDGPGGEGG